MPFKRNRLHRHHSLQLRHSSLRLAYALFKLYCSLVDNRVTLKERHSFKSFLWCLTCNKIKLYLKLEQIKQMTQTKTKLYNGLDVEKIMLLMEPPMSLFQCRCNNKSLIIIVGSMHIKSSLKMQCYDFFCLCISRACCHCYLGIVVIRLNQFSDLLT